MNRGTSPTHPMQSLTEGELELVMQFVLCSGSLKELAQFYSVSYPTIRSRLDQIILRLRELIEEYESDGLPGVVEELVTQGEVTQSAAQAIIDAHRAELRKHRE
jgi:hypothetical protein